MEPRERTLSFPLFYYMVVAVEICSVCRITNIVPFKYLCLQGWISERTGLLLPVPFSLKVSQGKPMQGKVKNFPAFILTFLFICTSLCSSREAKLSTVHRNSQQAE